MGRHLGFLLSSILAASVSVASQTHAAQEGVMNVRFWVVDQRVFVGYDLIGEKAYQVGLSLYENYKPINKTIDLSHSLKRVSGDVGPGVRPGKNKVIIWEPGELFSSLDGSAYFFEVRAVRLGDTNRWAWVVGSGAAGGAIGTVAWLKTRTKKGTIIIDVPDPEK